MIDFSEIFFILSNRIHPDLVKMEAGAASTSKVTPPGGQNGHSSLPDDSAAAPSAAAEEAAATAGPSARQLRKRKLNLNSLADGLTGDSFTCRISSCGVKVGN